jgi:DNA-binding LacI/PurR family transcriptional regulator
MEKTRVTLKDLAEELKVSVTTISKALNNHPDISERRKEEILKLIENSNYIPNSIAKSLRTRNSTLIGAVLSDNANPYNASVIKALEHVVSRESYSLLISNTDEQIDLEEKMIKNLLSINIGGVIVCPAMCNDKSVEILKQHNIPYVLINRYIDKDDGSYVVVDDVKAAKIGAEYLIKKYNRPVIFLCEDLRITTASNRLLGYKAALEEAGQQFDEKCLFLGAVGNEDGYRMLDKILERFHNNISILCYSDYIAIGVIQRLMELGISIPDEIAVVGIDGIEMFSPFLTSVHTPKFSLGTRCAEMMIDKMVNKGGDERVVMSDNIHILESTSA